MQNIIPSTRASMAIRMIFAAAAVATAAALALSAFSWWQARQIQWGPAASMVGLLVITLLGVTDPPRGGLRNSLSVFGVGATFIGAYLILALHQ
jgi:uncharacterized membrane protein